MDPALFAAVFAAVTAYVLWRMLRGEIAARLDVRSLPQGKASVLVRRDPPAPPEGEPRVRVQFRVTLAVYDQPLSRDEVTRLDRDGHARGVGIVFWVNRTRRVCLNG